MMTSSVAFFIIIWHTCNQMWHQAYAEKRSDDEEYSRGVTPETMLF
jgi:hypothetical protein